jgi:hypothetical protein
MLRTSVVTALIAIAGRVAHADEMKCEHDHAAAPQQEAHADPSSTHEDHVMLGAHAHHADRGGIQIAASLGVIVADYEAHLYRGDYQGVVAGASVRAGRFAVGVKLPSYRIVENGREVRGVGDVMVHAHAQLLGHRDVTAGVMMMASIPTGDGHAGLGMGHVMLMPEAWFAWSPASVSLSGTLGYGYAFGGASAHANHGGGMWPLVDPMNAQQVSYSASALLPLARVLGAGVRMRGATPIGTGENWLVAGAAVVWQEARVQTRLDVERGIVGDVFETRGMLETEIAF